MRSTQFFHRTFAFSLLFAGALAQAATVAGTVTNKTTGKPAAGDTVVLVDVQAGMAEVAHATTDARGHYSLNKPGSTPYLVRVTHQGAPYFIAAPEGNTPGDIPVYDVVPNVDGVFIEADVLELEAANGQLRVIERYFVHNPSAPPVTQWSPHSFGIVLPEEAVVESVSAQRPAGLPTSAKLDPDGPKGHYSFNFPIQPDDGDKSTLFNISYKLPYSSGKFTFQTHVTLRTQNVGVLLPKSMTFAASSGSVFQSVPENPGIQTWVSSHVDPAKALEFTVSGSGSMPREAQTAEGSAQQASGSETQDTGAASGRPGGGIGNPIDTPDPLTKYKWWILGGLALLLVAAAGVLLRKPPPGTMTKVGGRTAPVAAAPQRAAAVTQRDIVPLLSKNEALLAALKEELFALESERVSGTLSKAEYADLKAALEKLMRRALKR